MNFFVPSKSFFSCTCNFYLLIKVDRIEKLVVCAFSLCVDTETIQSRSYPSVIKIQGESNLRQSCHFNSCALKSSFCIPFFLVLNYNSNFFERNYGIINIFSI